MVAASARDTDSRAHPQRPVHRLMHRFDARSGNTVVFSKPDKTVAVVAKQTVLGAHPQESRAVLDDRLYRQILESLFLSVELEVIALTRQRGSAQKEGP